MRIRPYCRILLIVLIFLLNINADDRDTWDIDAYELNFYGYLGLDAILCKAGLGGFHHT